MILGRSRSRTTALRSDRGRPGVFVADLKSTFGGKIERGGGVSIAVTPDAAVLGSKVERWAELVDDNGPFFRSAEELIANHQRRHFDTEGGATGPRWAPLVDWYREWKEEVRPGRPILVFNGRLRKAVVDRGRGYRTWIGKTKATFGINPSHTTPERVKLIDYARAHQEGVPGLLRKRPVYRWDPTVQRATGGKMPLGTVLSQLRQAYIVRARRDALGADSIALGPMGDAERWADRLEIIKRRPTR